MRSSSFVLWIVRRLMSLLLTISPSKHFSSVLLWPVSKRLFGRGYTEIVRVYGGLQMEVYGDMEDMVNKTLLFLNGYKELAWEPMTARFVVELSKNIQVAINAGAHIGYFPLIISAANPNAQIFAFEPNPKNYERLKRNIELNGRDGDHKIKPKIEKIIVQNAALGKVSGEQKMYFDYGQSSFVNSNRQHSGEGVVRVTTVDEVFSNESVRPDLMIFDAEGYEPNILEGAAKTIEMNKPNIIFELNPKALLAAGSSPQGLGGFLKDRGYSIFIIDEDHDDVFSLRSGLEIKLTAYDAAAIANVSFVNAFATIHPNHFSKYLSEDASKTAGV